MEVDQLILQFQQKNVQAFEKLYEMYHQSIYGVIHTIVKNEAVADEVTQDVFIKAWNNAAQYSAKKGRFFTWLLNIARNAAIDKIRSKSFKDAQKNLDIDFSVYTTTTHNSLESQTNTIGIKTYVEKLTETCKTLIQLLYFKGFTQKETAETLEVPLGTVKTRARNCIKELRKMLAL